jgi:AcrR family transcriptional regulator
VPRRTQAERREATRAAIVEAAARRFVAQGLAGTTLDEIAADAEVTKGALYHYFASKDDLVVAFIEGMGTFDPSAGAVDRDAAIDEQLAQIGRAGATGEPPPELFALNLELYAVAVRNPVIREALGHRTRRSLEEIAGQHNSSLRSVVASAAMVEGLWIRRMLNPDQVSDSLFEQALAALAPLADSPTTNPA